MKILLFAAEKDASVLVEEIKEFQQVDPLVSNDYNHATRTLKDNKIQLIISGAKNSDSIKLFDFIKKTGNGIPFIWYTEVEYEKVCPKDFYDINPLNNYVSLGQPGEDLYNLIRDIILKKENTEVSKYVRIGVSRILKHEHLSADIYVKLSDNKMIKIINKNEDYDSLNISKYKEKTKYFYVKTADYPHLIKNMYESLKEKLKMNTKIDVVVEAQVEGISIVCNSIQHFKLDKDTEVMINEITSSCIETVKNVSSLKSLFDHFMKDKNGYLHKHSLLIGYLTSLTALKMKWNTSSALQKLTIAAILHDSSLKTAKEAAICALNEIEEADISKQDKQRIKMHALEVSEMVRNMKDIPPDVDSIILTHHEMPDGSGFPRGLHAAQVSQIAALFIIGETFVNNIYDKVLDKDQCIRMVEKMKSHFEKGNYRTPYYAFKEMIESYCN